MSVEPDSTASIKTINWSPKPFADLLNSKHRQPMWGLLRMLMEDYGHDPKLLREWEMFVRFCRAAGLGINPAEVEMLDPNSSRPAPPDLRCPLYEQLHYFELGEVIQEDLAAASAHRTRQLVSRDPLPLDRVLSPLETMLTKKLGKKYNRNAKPLSLVLYYSTAGPFWDFLEPLIATKRDDLLALFEKSGFDHLWVFDATASEVCLTIARPSIIIAN
jgi:hypothetical protein